MNTIIYQWVCVVTLILLQINNSNTKTIVEKPIELESRDSINTEHTHPVLPSEPILLTERLKEEKTNEFWHKEALNFVERQSKKKLNKNVAKNIIFFLGDGMSVPTTTAARVYVGGEEKTLSFQKFPTVGMSRTYCVDMQVSDSASTATAYLSGIKANSGTIGVSAKVKYNDCVGSMNRAEHTSSIAEWAMKAGKWAGLITTTRVTHASPTGVFGHIANRNWESDARVFESGCDPESVDDIAEQLIHGPVGKQLRVIMGGGRQMFRNRTVYDETGSRGARHDGKDLIRDWLNNNNGIEQKTYVWNATGLSNVDASKTDYLLGLFHNSHMKYNLQAKEQGDEEQPTLTDMVAKALEVLNKSEKGYFLFVEGGKIDLGHHSNKAHLALDETAEFSRAIDYAHHNVNEEDTLILVTSDHSHTMTMAGYPKRGNNIFGQASVSSHDKLPYLTLSYANGPSYSYHRNNRTGGRMNPMKLPHNQSAFDFPATVPISIETHGGDDVAVYTWGPWNHLFTGSFEQHVIPNVLAYAACIGEGKTVCDKK